ncbi:hypothetical protein MTR_1g492920 [Medicago truncatula]|uniref:RNase H type-1 domain-containing protein n=1 Tax=Medicago truncatula TaxID=3880 RepID=A0A072VN68_MEDTR|nr:hypothetical protein MTR_1g492920 [Medicago truncatula]
MAWKITTLQQVLPVTVIDSIKSLVPPYHGYIDDSIAWKLTSDGEFDNRSVYPLLQDLEIHYQQRIFPLLWSWKAELWAIKRGLNLAISILTSPYSCQSRRTSACGGAIGNCDGEFLLGFAENIGTCTITSAELWAMKRGLNLAISRGYRLLLFNPIL